MLDPLIKRLVAPMKPWLRRRLGDDYDLWANWAQARVQRLQRRTGHYRGVRFMWTMPGHSTIEPFELVGPAPGEILIETIASGVSPGTEIANFAVLPNTSPVFPQCPGYSAIGKVVAVGRGVGNLRAGDVVATQTAHASIAIAAVGSVAKLPRDLGPSASLHTMAWIAWHGIHMAGLKGGERVAVLGRGIVGQFCAQIARMQKPSTLASVARSNQFAGESLHRFCDQVLSTSEDDAWKDFAADVTFEVTGSPSALDTALDLTHDGGKIILLGSTRGLVDGIDFAKIAGRNIELIGAHTATMRSCGVPGVYDPQTVAQAVIAGLASGELDSEGLVEQTLAPSEAPSYYLRMADDRHRALGLVIDWTRLSADDRRGNIPFFGRPGRTHPTLLRPKCEDAAPSPTGVRPPVAVASPPVRIAVIGCGVQGQLNARDVAAADGCILAGVMDTQVHLAEKLAAEHGVPAWGDFSHVLASPDVDALFLVTPHHLHLPQVEAAAAAGKHVLVEKPLAANYSDAAALVRTVESSAIRSGTWLGYRYMPHVVEARRLVDVGAIGTLRGGELSYQNFKPLSYYRVSGWRAKWECAGGGVLIMNGIHFLDAFLAIAPEPPVEVSASYSTLATSESEVEDTLAMWIRFANGALATVQVSSCAMGMTQNGPSMRFFGQDGTLSLGHPHQIFTEIDGLGYPPGQWSILDPLPAMKPMGIEMVERFASGVRSGHMEISARDGLRVQAVIEAAYRSMREGRPIRLDELAEGPR